MTRERLGEIGLHWQQVLRLTQWQIGVRLVRASEIPQSRGQCAANSNKWQAIISIVDPVDAANIAHPEFPHDPERTLVHELLHLHFWHCDVEDDSPQGQALERAVDALSHVLVNLHRAPGTEKAAKRR